MREASGARREAGGGDRADTRAIRIGLVKRKRVRTDATGAEVLSVRWLQRGLGQRLDGDEPALLLLSGLVGAGRGGGLLAGVGGRVAVVGDEALEVGRRGRAVDVRAVLGDLGVGRHGRSLVVGVGVGCRWVWVRREDERGCGSVERRPFEGSRRRPPPPAAPPPSRLLVWFPAGRAVIRWAESGTVGILLLPRAHDDDYDDGREMPSSLQASTTLASPAVYRPCPASGAATSETRDSVPAPSSCQSSAVRSASTTTAGTSRNDSSSV